jgi:hypothetical protein
LLINQIYARKQRTKKNIYNIRSDQKNNLICIPGRWSTSTFQNILFNWTLNVRPCQHTLHWGIKSKFGTHTPNTWTLPIFYLNCFDELRALLYDRLVTGVLMTWWSLIKFFNFKYNWHANKLWRESTYTTYNV